MGVEIERKFLVVGSPPLQEGTAIVQGYLCKDPDRTVRVRMEGERAFLTIKGKSEGLTRAEFEYEIPLQEARGLMELVVGDVVEKSRYLYRAGNHVWEIDVFAGKNIGLVVAEIELSREDEPFEKPDWIGDEVSHDSRYANSSLSSKPVKEW